MSHCSEYGVGGDFAQIGFEQEAYSFGCAWHCEREAYEDDDDGEEHGHHEFGISFDAVLYASCHDEVCEQEECGEIDDGLQGCGHKGVEGLCEIGVALYVQVA